MKKKLLTLGLFFFLTLKSFAQTDGISYQAVIIAPDVLELPGVDSQGNYLPNANVAVKFTIFDSGNLVEFEEIQTTTTDDFGRINLIIGAIEHDNFEKISWDGTPKDLKVEIDFGNGGGYVDMNREILTFVPYAYHRNITATGTLDVDDDTFLNRELTVNGPTTLNSTLLVNDGNETNLTGDLTVDGITNLNNNLNVNNKSTTNLSGALNVGAATGLPDDDAPTVLNGNLTVVGESAFTGLTVEDLTVKNSTDLTGSIVMKPDTQLTITSSVNGSDKDITKYPVRIEGGNQGLAIVVDGSRKNANNFVSFWDTTTTNGNTISGESLTYPTPTMWGRIEGEIESEFGNNADYRFDQNSLNYDILDGGSDYAFALIDAAIAGATLGAALADVRPCAGLGACVVSPGPAPITAAIGNSILALGKGVTASIALANSINNKVVYDNNKITYQGVTYASGAGDYAEYLLRENVGEKITYGDVVGVKGGRISKNTANAEKAMVISRKPIVLGNMPKEKNKNNFEKVAFMGQVPVKVYGKVEVGDYIIPSGKNDGIGVAIKPSSITTSVIKKIVGIAWEAKPSLSGFSMINVAVGLNNNDNNPIIEKLENEILNNKAQIADLKSQVSQILDKLSNIESGKTSEHISPKAEIQNYDERPYEIVDSEYGEIIYFELERKDFEAGFEFAKKQLVDSGVDLEKNEFWKKIQNDPNFKNVIIDKLQKKFDQQMHYHKEISAKKH